MQSQPFLSVVLPTYNRKAMLKVALDGLARQEWPLDDFEVVAVSDGSTDGTDAMLAEYAASAPYRLRPIVQENGGPSRARNRGIAEAQGVVVVFLDDDMEPTPGFLAAHARHHREDDRVVVIGPMNRAADHAPSEPVWIAWEHDALKRQYDNFLSGRWPKAGPNHFYSGNASVRREHLRAVGGFDETFKRQEDVEMAFRLSRRCGVRFVFDGAAAGWHRPSRTFESWARTPYAYGRLDVVRARDGKLLEDEYGDHGWPLIRKSYHGRNRLTRLLARLTLPRPALAGPVYGALRGGATLLYRAPGMPDRAAYALLSALFNLRYLEGARDEMGGWEPLQQALFENAPSDSAAVARAGAAEEAGRAGQGAAERSGGR